MPGNNLESEQRRSFFGGALHLEGEDLLRWIPQRIPLVMLDRVLALVPRRHAVAVKSVTGNEFGLSTRDHGFIFPATFALEGLVQLATVAFRYEEGARSPRPKAALLLENVLRMEVRREVVSGSRLFFTVWLTSGDEERVEVRGEAALEGEIALEAEFSLRPDPDQDRAPLTLPLGL